jgi:predicted DNA-binding transcriptional regulator YafY
VVIPKELGEMEYRGKRYIGMKAYCTLRAGERVFRVDRILELNVLRQTEA